MIVIAHRGMHDQFRPPNGFDAIEAALRSGFGVEIDVRMEKRGCNGNSLVVSHDTPPEYGACLAQDVADLVVKRHPGAMIAVDVKEEGLFPRVKREFSRMENAVYFDLSGPDLFRYSKAGLRCLERISDFGERPIGIGGLWVDGLEGDWPCDAEGWGELSRKALGLPTIAFVSPEIHGRGHEKYWLDVRRWVDNWRGKWSFQFAICTDIPREADRFFNVGRPS